MRLSSFWRERTRLKLDEDLLCGKSTGGWRNGTAGDGRRAGREFRHCNLPSIATLFLVTGNIVNVTTRILTIGRSYEARTRLQACRTGVGHGSDTDAATTQRTRVSEVCPALPLQFLNSKPSDMAANRSNFFLQWWLTPSGQLQASLYSLFSHRLCALCYAFVNCNVKKDDFSFDYLTPFPSVFDFTSCLTL